MSSASPGTDRPAPGLAPHRGSETPREAPSASAWPVRGRRAETPGPWFRPAFSGRGLSPFPWLTCCALAILALIFGLLLSESHTRLQFLSMVALTATIAAGSAIARRMREA